MVGKFSFALPLVVAILFTVCIAHRPLPTDDRRIPCGLRAERNTFTWIVWLFSYGGTPLVQTKGIGVLIEARDGLPGGTDIVLTAPKCEGDDIGWAISLGALERIKVKRFPMSIQVPPNVAKARKEKRAGVLKLVTPIMFGNQTAAPLCLPESHESVVPPTNGYTISTLGFNFGDSDFGWKEIHATIVPLSDCVNGNITTMICVSTDFSEKIYVGAPFFSQTAPHTVWAIHHFTARPGFHLFTLLLK